MNRAPSIVLLLIYMISSTLAAPNTHLRIVGGEDAKEGQFFYMISLKSSNFHICGGSIISPNVILTAAHCVYSESVQDLTVVAGSLKLREGGDSYQVKEVIVHEDYDVPKIKNDLALLILVDDIVMTDKVGIVKLRGHNRDEHEECVLSGWGRTAFPGGVNPDNLQFVNLVTTTQEECSYAWNSSWSTSDNQSCTLTKMGEGFCFGDSGGPLVDSQAAQIGVVSGGKPCGTGMPDVYTSVASYIDWIEEKGKQDQTN